MAAATTSDNKGVALPTTISYTPAVPTIPAFGPSAAPAQILYEAKN